MLTSRADGGDVADEEGRDLAGQLRGPGDGVPGGRVDSAPPAARAAVLVREERADLGLSGIASAAGDVVGRPEVPSALGITRIINYLPGRVRWFVLPPKQTSCVSAVCRKLTV